MGVVVVNNVLLYVVAAVGTDDEATQVCIVVGEMAMAEREH